MSNDELAPDELTSESPTPELVLERPEKRFSFVSFLLWNVLWLFIVAPAPLALLPLLQEPSCNPQGWICFTLGESLILATMFIYLPVSVVLFLIAGVIMGFPKLSPRARYKWTAKQLSWKVCLIPVLLYYITVVLTYVAILTS